MADEAAAAACGLEYNQLSARLRVWTRPLSGQSTSVKGHPGFSV